MRRLAVYPFSVIRQNCAALAVAFIPLIILIGSLGYLTNDFSVTGLANTTEKYLGANLALSASDIKQYDNIGGEGIIPLIRFGAITKGITPDDFRSMVEFTNPFMIVIFMSVLAAYLCYAVVSRIVYDLSRGEQSFGLRGLNFSSVAISIIAAIVFIGLSSFAMQGFQLVIMLNICVFFVLAMPHAAAGENFGECFFKAFDYLRFNLRGIIEMYLICLGAAIAIPIGLLIVFLFPLSSLNSSAATIAAGFIMSVFAIGFALFYQFTVCSRTCYEFSRPVTARTNAYRTKLAKRVK
ncbi:MAG: hypothetical protein V1911_00825 [Candidatus Micrarchaeota archaeon]